MQIVILSGGLAKRLRLLTIKVPKSMIRINGKPFLEYQIELLKKNEIRDIVLCVGHLHEQIIEYFGDGSRLGVNITYSYERDKLLGTGGALKNAEQYLCSEFFVMYGDSYLPIDFKKVYQYFIEHNVTACMTVYKNNSLYDDSNIIFKNGYVKVYNKNKRSQEMQYIDYGLIILSKKVLAEIPEAEFFDLADILSNLAKANELLGYEVYSRFYEIGSFNGQKDFEKYVNGGLA